MLTINHDNYDTWLMLYLDNELTAAERDAVEAFAKANPAVQEELDGLREAMLQPELPVAMPGKERLLMPEIWNEEALSLQQQQLLLLADNELPAAEITDIEAAIDQNPLLKREWDLLQKTKMATGLPLEMPGKDQLYRHERTRVIPFGRIARFAAAAAILGFGWFFVNNMVGNSSTEPGKGQVATRSTEDQPAQLVNGKDTTAYPEVEMKQPQKEALKAYAAEEIKEAPSVNIQRAIARNITPEQDKNIAGEINTIEKPVEMFASTGSREPAEKLVATEVIVAAGISENEMPPVLSTATIELAVHQDQHFDQTEVMDAEGLTDEGTISIGGARIPKQKIRSVYRNITRPITRTLERNGLQLAYAK